MAGCHLDRRFPVQHLKAELMICVGVFWHFQLLAEGLLLVGAVETEWRGGFDSEGPDT